jgi:hypothetical protein
VFLFKAAATTYRKVVKQKVHAFPYSPRDASEDEFVLLSKNKADCAQLERQIQYVAKLLTIRRGTAQELEGLFPNVRAGARWNYVAELYWRKPLLKPFNLSQVPGFNYKRYNTVQGFAKLDDADALALVPYLARTNAEVLLDLLNNAERP